MNPSTPHLALRDIHLPEPISWWPPAPGWWILLFLGLLLCLAVWLFYKRRQKKKHQRISLQSLTQIRSDFDRHLNKVTLLRELSVLMRRSCITFYPRELSAGLTGEQWLGFLDATSGNNEFSNGVGKILASAPYLPEQAQIDIDSQALLELCESWLRAQPDKKYLAKMRKSDLPDGARA
jgi:hypothetical protein